MKAMDLVAASKLQKAKSRLDDVRPLYDNIKIVMDGIKAGIGSDENVAFAEESCVVKGGCHCRHRKSQHHYKR